MRVYFTTNLDGYLKLLPSADIFDSSIQVGDYVYVEMIHRGYLLNKSLPCRLQVATRIWEVNANKLTLFVELVMSDIDRKTFSGFGNDTIAERCSSL